MVLNGKRPIRPIGNNNEDMSDGIWDLTNWCWADNPNARPTAQQVLDELVAANGGTISSHIGEPDPLISLHTRQNGSSEQLLVFLRLDGVERINTVVPVAGGRSSDIFIGKYHGHRVALRRFRMFLRAEGERKLYDVSLRPVAGRW